MDLCGEFWRRGDCAVRGLTLFFQYAFVAYPSYRKPFLTFFESVAEPHLVAAFLQYNV